LDPRGNKKAERSEALRLAAAAIQRGEIVALLGLGGFQLIVDALSREAVCRLRERKRRPHKPFAVMFPCLDSLKQWCDVTSQEITLLLSPQAPIVLVRRRCGVPAGLPNIAEEVAPGNPYLGVMLPYTPLHHLLMAAVGRPVVCTSGNLSEEPMAVTVSEGLDSLGGIADVFLVHNRPIVRPVDDSVCRIFRGKVQLIRRARGYAPLPWHATVSGKIILAVGAHQKVTVGLQIGTACILSAHVGDLDNRRSIEVYRRSIADLLDFYKVEPEVVVCDLHPDYVSTTYAEEFSRQRQVPLIRVQHHHAHVAACMAEHHLKEPVLGVAWDGTGYGPDGTIWGGEFLLIKDGTYRRVAHLRTFPLPGGDQVAREPRRSALGLLFAWGATGVLQHTERLFSPQEIRFLEEMLCRGVRAPQSSSVGRLFDAVAALLGCSPRITFEGQAAMELEYLVDADGAPRYRLPLRGEDPLVLDWGPLLEGICSDLAAGTDAGRIAWGFHEALAESICQVASRIGVATVVLTGGCFQNRWLAELAVEKLQQHGFQVYWPQAFPPNDGGIALGQLFVAANQVG
jgi:hydrogenase maturation protein HypF